MTPLQWQTASDAANPQPVSQPGDHHAARKKQDPWFAVSIALLGLIVGFWLSRMNGS